MSIYDRIYAEDETYNYRDIKKIKLVHKWLKKHNLSRVLDVGCGKGHYMKYLLKQGVKVTGLEPSKFACDNYLKGYQVINLPILKASGKWDGLYCMDVLEHIDYGEIDDNIKKLVSLAPYALFGIANHSDVWQGTELHLIREAPAWWQELLSKYYSDVTKTFEEGEYFIFEASNDT